MFEVESHNPEDHTMTWSKGGFQGGRGWQVNGSTGALDPVPPFYIENVFEELDIPGEWFFDEEKGRLYLFWNATSGEAPPKTTQFVAPQLHRLVNIVGTKASPVRGITIRGIGLRGTKYTYMEPSGGDWALHRGGAVFLESTEQTSVEGWWQQPY